MSASPQPRPIDSIGERLCAERTRLGLTQSELATALGVSRASVTLYETDRNRPGSDVLIGLNRLQADILFILTGERKEPVFSAAALDMDRLALALKEARRQLGLSPEQQDQREILNRAWVIYRALTQFLSDEVALVPSGGR